MSTKLGEQEDSLSFPAVGRQHNSTKPTLPSFSFGIAHRDATRKQYLSKKHEKKMGAPVSPGPVYRMPAPLGSDALACTFGESHRPNVRAKYPESSIDLTCATIDNQKVKFHSTPGVHFGTEPRMDCKNGDIVRVHPALAFGVESPGALEYSPREQTILKASPDYSFGKKVSKIEPNAYPEGRLKLPLSSSPRHLGPGSHNHVSGIGSQPVSARSSAPSWSFGCSEREKQVHHLQLMDTSPDLSSLGRQVVSKARTAPSCGFGTSTRRHRDRLHHVCVGLDRGPAADMPKQRYAVDIPPPVRHGAKVGL